MNVLLFFNLLIVHTLETGQKLNIIIFTELYFMFRLSKAFAVSSTYYIWLWAYDEHLYNGLKPSIITWITLVSKF